MDTVKRALKNEHKDGFRVGDESERYRTYDMPNLPSTFTIGQTEYTPLEWGLIPHWAKDIDHARELQKSAYNAKSETMFDFDKPMFRDAAVHGVA